MSDVTNQRPGDHLDEENGTGWLSLDEGEREARIAQLRQALVHQALEIVKLRREVSRLQIVEEAAFPRRKRVSQL